MVTQASTVRTYPLLGQAPLQSTSLPLPQTSATDWLAAQEAAYGLTPLQSTALPLPQSTGFTDLGYSSSPNMLKSGGLAFMDLNDMSGSTGNIVASPLDNYTSVLNATTTIQDPNANLGFLGNLKNEWGNLSSMNKMGVGLSAAMGLFNMYNGFQQARQMKSYMKNQMNLANKQYANNVKTYNTNLEDRQMRRKAANEDAESVESYMARNRVG